MQKTRPSETYSWPDMAAPFPFRACDLAGGDMWVFWVEFESGPLCRLERRVEDDGCRVVSVEGVVSALWGDFRFREAVGVDWELGVGPVPAGGAAGVSAAATSGAGADGWAAAWLAAKRAADLVSLGGMGSAWGVSGRVTMCREEWAVCRSGYLN